MRSNKYLLTGGNGFLGQHVRDKLLQAGVIYDNIIIPDHSLHDLRNAEVCLQVTKNIDIVIHLAGTVGGIGFNRRNPGSLFYDNITMGVNLIEASRINNVKKFVCIGTVCSYPKFTPIPFIETNLWNGYPEETNAPYGLAKKALLVMLQSYRLQYGFHGIYLIPVNMYGPGDNFDPESSHVIAALIKKIYEAKIKKLTSIEVWGDGSATREFIYVEDAALAIVKAAQKYDSAEPINIGAGFEISIKELVQKLTNLMNYHGTIKWNRSKPNGQPRRSLDTSRAQKELGFIASTGFDNGLHQTIEWYYRYITQLKKTHISIL